MTPNAKSIVNACKEIRRYHDENFSKYTLLTTKLPGGPYALFHHHSLFIERVKNISNIIERMGRCRVRITRLNTIMETFEARIDADETFFSSKPVQSVLKKETEATELMRLDNETLYVFGNLSLDQWSYTIAYSLGLPDPDKYDFNYLIQRLQSRNLPHQLSSLKARHFKDAIWLYYQLRFYRNIFIEHVRRPWQRGSSMSTYGTDFNFFILTPPGWIPDALVTEKIESVSHLAPAWTINLSPRSWQRKPKAFLQIMYENIDSIDQQSDREKIWNVWSEVGGSTVSFDLLGQRLIDFFRDSAVTVIDYLKDNPDTINFGPSPFTQVNND